MQTTITVGDAYRIDTGVETFEIKVVGLDLKCVTFMATGQAVKNPDNPRVMPIVAFANWIKGLKGQAQRIQTQEMAQ